KLRDPAQYWNACDCDPGLSTIVIDESNGLVVRFRAMLQFAGDTNTGIARADDYCAFLPPMRFTQRLPVRAHGTPCSTYQCHRQEKVDGKDRAGKALWPQYQFDREVDQNGAQERRFDDLQ